jgi:hypothetical protein
MIFAREVSDNLTGLVKKIDGVTSSTKGTGSFVVFLNDEEGLDKKLKEVASKAGLSQCVLTIESPAGPGGYNIAKEADVTVILYKGRKVVHNHAFKKGELKTEDIEKIVKEYEEIAGKK